MPDRIIRNGRVETDTWRFVAPPPHVKKGESYAAKKEDVLPETVSNPETWGDGSIVVSLGTWKAHRSALLARDTPLGVWLKGDDEPGDLAADLDRLALVAVNFNKFTDGRGYSTANLLRTRYGYRGELRAFGDVGRDQLFYLARCGFDAFRLADHHDPESALASFSDFTVRYQGSVDDPVPLYRKRAVAGERP
jgi:uncharacterized protein (DUF934 family)